MIETAAFLKLLADKQAKLRDETFKTVPKSLEAVLQAFWTHEGLRQAADLIVQMDKEARVDEREPDPSKTPRSHRYPL